VFEKLKLLVNAEKTNIKALTKLVIAKNWGGASDLLSQYSNSLKINLCEEALPTPGNGVRWRMIGPDACNFVFNSSTPQAEYRACLTRLILLLPIIEAFHASTYFQVGSIFINLGDWADCEGLAFCSNREDSLLIPDIDFLSSLGYQKTMLDFMVNSPPWAMRRPIAFWRGNTTGIRVGDSWRGLPRVRLCAIANQLEHRDLFEVGISSFAQVSKREAKEIKTSGFAKDFVPINNCAQFKYQIDIDGNSNAWSGLFQKLLSGSVVLKVESPHGFRQWYYDDLLPWENFVPVKSDLSDLIDNIMWLKNNDEKAKEIGDKGKELALKLSYQKEMNKAVIKISRALKMENVGSGE
jgi:Glycosyl transferase family 90